MAHFFAGEGLGRVAQAALVIRMTCLVIEASPASRSMVTPDDAVRLSDAHTRAQHEERQVRQVGIDCGGVAR